MYERELKIAIQAVKKSEPTFRKYFGTKPKTQIKEGDFRNIVTFVDRKIENEMKKFLLSKFPEHGFVGEESGGTKTASHLVWVADPIDGTTNYIYGNPDCGITLALLENKKPVVGVIHSPIMNRLFWAVTRKGAWLNNRPIKVSKNQELKKTYGGFGWGKDVLFASKNFPKTVKEVAKLRVLGSSTVTLANVGTGIFDFFIGHDMNIWDYAAGQLIVEEAGGVFIETKKPRIQIAANKILAKKLTALLSSHT